MNLYGRYPLYIERRKLIETQNTSDRRYNNTKHIQAILEKTQCIIDESNKRRNANKKKLFSISATKIDYHCRVIIVL